jgi:hypothetical protein
MRHTERLRRLERRFAPEIDHREILERVVAAYEAARAAGHRHGDAECLAGATVAAEYQDPRAAQFASSNAAGIPIIEPDAWFDMPELPK